MDSERFRRTYREINERLCPFEKVLLTQRCQCKRAQRFCIAEREGVCCNRGAAQQRCVLLLDLLEKNARFVLKVTRQKILPHGKALRMQAGGVLGLYRALYPEKESLEKIPDVDALIECAITRFGGVENFPFPAILSSIRTVQGRRPRRNRT